jgi:hypothetical protein
MKIFGISLRRPDFNAITAAAVMGVGLWVLAVGLMRLAGIELDAVNAGALLVVTLWGCISAHLGIRIGMGQRHLAANLLVSAVLLLIYQGAWALAA